MTEVAARSAGAREIGFSVNGRRVSVTVPPIKRLADVLRDDLRLTGTKIGCNAGDCGACTVLIDGRQACACLTPVARAEGRTVVTVEGLAAHGVLSRLQQAFQRHGAAQCGICTPGMLIAAAEVVGHYERPTEAQVMDALAGVLCRCTGYRKIVEAVIDAAGEVGPLPSVPAGAAVGARVAKVDGVAKVTGAEVFGADAIPDDALWLRVVRSPHARAEVTLGDLDAFVAARPGLLRVLTAANVPNNGFGIYPDVKDQPVLADGIVRYRGEAVVALVGERTAVSAVLDEEVPITYRPLPAVDGLDAALADGATPVHAGRPDNVLIEGGIAKGDAAAAFADCAVVVEGEFETAFVEHAYIEPEAGYARRVGDRVELHVTTQSPYMDRDEVAQVLGLAPEAVRIVPTACGGGFGGKLDQSVQPLIAVAAWLVDRPVACVYTRPESMAATTKRHPARVRARFGCDGEGKLRAVDVAADFDTGAYASWGPTVTGRVPIHATGPYFVPHVRARGRGVFTNNPPAGAFRGFGVPQVAIAHEALMDRLADAVGRDRLEFRLLNALGPGDATATGQVLETSVGLIACLEAIRPHWQALRAEAEAHNRTGAAALRRGVGIGCMWYGIGNTVLANPSVMRVALFPDGRIVFYSGAADIGQGANTILTQICADALGVEMTRIELVTGDTDRTGDAGKTSASRQTFVSGKATELAATDLRRQILRLANAGPEAEIEFAPALRVREGGVTHTVDLGRLPVVDDEGAVLVGHGRFDPPTSPLDEKGQGVPYATYGFAAQIALVEVDVELGTVRPLRIVAAHDVGRAINPTQVEGQIQGGIAQGLGLALMEEYRSGVTDNLHDYLIPTVGDVPEIEVIIVEDAEPLGPSGAKGVGEPGLVPTAPAILGAVRDATGVEITRVPATPDRVRAALLAAGREAGRA